MKQISFSTKLTLLLLSMMTMMSNVAIVTMLPHLSSIFKEIPNIELLSRLMITLPSLSIAFLAPFMGSFVKRIGKKRAALIALIAFSFFGTAGLYLETIYELLISRFFFGIAIAVLMIVTTSLVGDYFEGHERHKYMGLQSAFMSVGGILFIVGGGWLSDISWHYPFAIYFFGLFVFLFAVRYIVEVDSSKQSIQSDEFLNHNLWYIYLLAFLLMLIFYILPTQMPFLMINFFHASGSLTGAIIATAFVFNALGALTFAKLKKSFSFAQIYLVGMSVIALGFVLIGLVEEVHFFFLTSPMMGFGGGLLMANMTAWMLHVAHHTKRIKSSAYLTSALFLGQFASPLITHPAVVHFGIKHFFIFMGVVLFFGIAISIVAKKLRKNMSN
jgi:MFS family permease